MPERTHGGVYPDLERVDMVITQMPILGFGEYYVEAVQAARDALARESTGSEESVTVVEWCGWRDCSSPHYGQRFVLGGDAHVAPVTLFCPGAPTGSSCETCARFPESPHPHEHPGTWIESTEPGGS